MSDPILAVDRDTEVFRRERDGWRRHGIDVLRVDSMSEAVERAGQGMFFFLSINADNIGYLPMLPVLHEVSGAPIFIITSHFTLDAQMEALHNGAEVYVPFQSNVEENIMSALAYLHRYGQPARRTGKRLKTIPYRKLLVLPGLNQVFCGNEEVPLTRTEYKIFIYLLANRGIKVSFRQIYRRVWGIEYEDKDHRLLWNHIIRMRGKIAAATGEDGYIENKRGIGFWLPAENAK